MFYFNFFPKRKICSFLPYTFTSPGCTCILSHARDMLMHWITLLSCFTDIAESPVRTRSSLIYENKKQVWFNSYIYIITELGSNTFVHLHSITQFGLLFSFSPLERKAKWALNRNRDITPWSSYTQKAWSIFLMIR